MLNSAAWLEKIVMFEVTNVLGKIKVFILPPKLISQNCLLDSFVEELLFFNWDSLHARLNSHFKAWSYKKKKHKKI